VNRTTARSWGVEVHTLLDDHQIWYGNALRFASEREALDYAAFYFRSTDNANAWRVFPSQLDANATWHG